MKKTWIFVILVCSFILGLCPSAIAADETPLTIVMPKTMQKVIYPLVEAYEKASGNEVDIKYTETPDDYVTAIHTEILAGGGPDLFLAGSIPYWDYAKMGMLVDFDNLIEKDPDIDIGDYRENIIDPLRDPHGKLYVMPVSYRYYVVIVNTPLLDKYGVSLPDEWTLESVYNTCIEFTEKTKGVPDVYAMNGGSAFWDWALSNEISFAIDFSKGKSHINELPDSLFTYLNHLDEISHDGFFNPRNLSCVFTMSFSKQCLDISPSSVWSWTFFENSDFEFRTFPRVADHEKAMYYLESAFCINKNGDVDKAWDFVKFTLSDQVQSEMRDSISEPVRKSAADYRFRKTREYLATIMERVENDEEYTHLVGDTSHSPDEYEAAVETYISKYSALLENVGVPELMDARLAESIDKILEPEHNGKIDPMIAKTEIARIVDVYMQEVGGDLVKGYTTIYFALAVVGIVAAAGGITAVIRKRRRKKR